MTELEHEPARMRYICTLVLSAGLLAAACTQDRAPQEKSSTPATQPELGTPITSDNLVDVLNIQRIIAAQIDAYDRQDWPLALGLLTEEIETTIGQDGVGTITAEAFIERGKAYHERTERFVTHHATSGYRIFFHDADTASAFARGSIIVESTPGGAHADAGGSLRMERSISYEYGLARKPEGWRINAILITHNADRVISSTTDG